MPNRRKTLKQLAGIGLSLCLPKLAMSQNAEELPKVLLLGDSISMGYTPVVQDYLEDKAIVVRPTFEDGRYENCEGTTKGIRKVPLWIGNIAWDVIHFNFGLHDIKHVDPTTGKNSNNPLDPQQAAPKFYRKNLKAIVKFLKGTEAQLIFATTTPYPTPVGGPLRLPGMPERYNAIATKIMRKHKIPVNDLYDYVLPHLEELQIPANVHFTEKGSQALGKQVSEVIAQYL